MYTIYRKLNKILHGAIFLLIRCLKQHLGPDELAYVPIQSSSFPSTTPPPYPPLTYKEYKIIATQQHIEEYFKQFQLPFPPSTPCSGACQRSVDEYMLGYPVLGDLVRAELDLKAAEAARARAQQC
jgi:hypothetical protein